MSQKQHTIVRAVSLEGKGLHTGHASKITFHPAPENHGRIFQREDLENQPMIPALSDYVVDTSRGTTLGINGVKVHTVEHVMSALAGLGIDNVTISLDGPEPPILDGSALGFVSVLLEAGLLEQEAERKFFVVDETLSYSDEGRDVHLSISASSVFELEVNIDFNSEVLKSQMASFSEGSDYSGEIADSRTFCFLHELEAMYAAGLIQGGNLDSAVVIMDRPISQEEMQRLKDQFGPYEGNPEAGILNATGFRHENEPARHKLLDLIGDLALCGMAIKGKVHANRPGHAANVELAKKIRSKIKRQQLSRRFMKEEQKGIVFDINAITEILPHRYPFLLVDKIIDFDENTIVGIKNVTINEPFFQGHFPGNPIMPGVLQLEAMAQVGGILLLNNIENPKTVWVYFLAIDNARFKKPVKPGDTLKLELEMTAMKRNICKMTGRAYVDGVLVCSADLVASVVQK
ncbi:MAG: bifunctional UDP-3-O-[3-hydroxymyristoyl] N-acetylglucosamine deacetylase/3-hydroxyacyl-ACP dehydratase [Bacteroidia bacterium]|nr:bifunctional UDP-3-O-[3-hydroxymyristoyl] N-acetylglucosamine deacetylase/3-hydroxyacyl-ACP dehydratase [Bacteroidia bacterium]